jgi:hypothetical protein
LEVGLFPNKRTTPQLLFFIIIIIILFIFYTCWDIRVRNNTTNNNNNNNNNQENSTTQPKSISLFFFLNYYYRWTILQLTFLTTPQWHLQLLAVELESESKSRRLALPVERPMLVVMIRDHVGDVSERVMKQLALTYLAKSVS